jgi:N utilization substance protein A
MENLNIVEALTQIAREKSVDRKLVIQTLSEALISAAKKRYGNADNFAVNIDANTGRMSVVANKTVVEEVIDPTTQIDLLEAQRLDEQAQLGGVVAEPLNFSEFGRNAIQTAKQVLIQRMREAERERVHEAFAPRVGQIESGVVQQISQGDIILNLGRAEAAVPLKEQIRRERYRQGDTVRGYIFDVLKVSKGPQILLSRTHPEFLRKLFSIEVPEISDGIVKIHSVAREPGERAKIAVSSNDDRVDPVGACVGVKGSRVQAIVRELSGERIDIVPWSEETSVFISRALSPAAVARVILDHRRKHAIVIVEEGQLSLAIGKSGQNSRLAVQLTGWGLDIITHDKYQERRAQIDVYQVELRRVPGVSELIALSLITSGFTTIASVAEATVELLRTVPGLEGSAANQVKESAQNYLNEHPEGAQAPEPAPGAAADNAEGAAAMPPDDKAPGTEG